MEADEMNPSQPAIVKDLVLVGGGHTHVIVLKNFAMNPIPGVRLTVIARDVHTPYSGMLPGFLAGHYTFDEAHIDLRPLCRFAGARLYHDEATGLDLETKHVVCKRRPTVLYDLLSINIGSTPSFEGVPGADALTTPVKPINTFVERWLHLVDRVLNSTGALRIGVVGAGAGGTELLLSMQYRLQQLLAARGRVTDGLEFHLMTKSDTILPQSSPGLRRSLSRVLAARGIQVHTGAAVETVMAGKLILSGGKTIELDETLWVTNAGAPSWLADTGLAVDAEGFIEVGDTLRSTSHEDVFAAGDIAAVVNHPRPKAGVFAVRQGPPLARNLRRALLGRPPRPFSPQRAFLVLISTGDEHAVAAKWGWTAEGRWVWRWKDWIDRRFMQRFSDLPEMTANDAPVVDPALADPAAIQEVSAAAMHCGGCGAKVGADVLGRVLGDLETTDRADVLVGLGAPDDAAVLDVPDGKVMVSSVDYFRAFIDDAYVFGQVAANHAWNDIFAMGAEPQSALAIATVPFGLEAKVEATLRDMMAGALEVCEGIGAALVGGHTSEGAELALGFSVNGLADRDTLLRKSGMAPGEVLVLTKALGTGTLFAADMRQKAKGRWIEGALASMVRSNRDAARCFARFGATGCTDISGFGLLGHVVEMTKASGTGVEIDLDALPVLDGARETLGLGILSSLHPANERLGRAIGNAAKTESHALYPLVFDPQTSGGLLASLPADRAEACLAALREAGYGGAVIIGRVEAAGRQLHSVTLISGAR
jgi:selenide,water dikinase